MYLSVHLTNFLSGTLPVTIPVHLCAGLSLQLLQFRIKQTHPLLELRDHLSFPVVS